jgi:hypothetical protein
MVIPECGGGACCGYDARHAGEAMMEEAAMTERSMDDSDVLLSDAVETPAPVPAPIVAPDASLAGVVEGMIEVIGETCVTRPEFMKLIEPLRQ